MQLLTSRRARISGAFQSPTAALRRLHASTIAFSAFVSETLSHLAELDMLRAAHAHACHGVSEDLLCFRHPEIQRAASQYEAPCLPPA
eukprot:scaffold529_cov308-Pinguiococcus_pyrenoidosus.AAC.25